MAMEKEEMLKFGRWLKASRKGLGLTQKELAAEIKRNGGEISYPTIQGIEAGTIKAIGPRIEGVLMKFFENCEVRNSAINIGGKGNLSVTGNHPVVVSDIMHRNDSASSMDTVALAKMILDPKFREKIDGIQSMLGVDEDHAIRIVLEAELRGKK